MWQTKYASAVPKNLGVEVNFRPCSEGHFLSGRPYSVFHTKHNNYDYSQCPGVSIQGFIDLLNTFKKNFESRLVASGYIN